MSDGTREPRVGDSWVAESGCPWAFRVESVGEDSVLVKWTRGLRKGWQTSITRSEFKWRISDKYARLVTEASDE